MLERNTDFHLYISGYDRDHSPTSSVVSDRQVRIDIIDTTDTEIDDEYKRKRKGKNIYIYISDIYK